jgi:RHS repeat-associated protein
MASTIGDGGNSIAYTYDSEHQRITQAQTGADAGTTTYLTNPVTGTLEELFTATGNPTVARDYISAGGQLVALRSVSGTADTPPLWGASATKWGSFKWTSMTLSYFIHDNLGSIAVITNSTGGVVQRLSYDAWGKRRNANGTAAACGAITSSTTDRGFTGQEMMDSVCTINFNARLYDPSLGRFLSADPVRGTVFNLQALDPYAYVLNNPLSLTDPSGMCVFGICTWFKSPIFRSILAIALVVVFQQYEILPQIGAALGFTTSSAAFAAVVNGGILGGIAGFISTGTIKGAGLGILQGALFAEAGNLLDEAGDAGFFGLGHDASEFVAHGLVGGIVNEIGSDSFVSGFLAAGVSSLGPSPEAGQTWEQTAAGTVEHAVLGGLGSILGGGKFANGAATGAFGYLFNEVMHQVAANDNEPRQCNEYCGGVGTTEAADKLPGIGPGGQPFVPQGLLPTQSQYILQGRWIDPETGEVNLTTPPGYIPVAAPTGGGYLFVAPDWTPGDTRNVIRVQPYGTGSSTKFGYSNGYYVVTNQAGAAISIYSGQQFPVTSPAVHNELGRVAPNVGAGFGN